MPKKIKEVEYKAVQHTDGEWWAVPIQEQSGWNKFKKWCPYLSPEPIEKQLSKQLERETTFGTGSYNSNFMSDPFSNKSDEDYYRTVTWVYRCITTIAQAAAGAPFKLMQKTMTDGKETKEEIKEGDVYELLQNPNPLSTWYDFTEAVFINMELFGTSFWEKIPFRGDDKDKIAQLWCLLSGKMQVVPHPTKYIDHFKYIPIWGNIQKLPVEDVVYMKYYDPSSDVAGLGPTTPALSAIHMDIRVATYGDDYFRNGAVPLIALEAKDKDVVFSKPQVNRMKADWNSIHKGYKNWHKIAVLPGGLSLKVLSSTLKNLDLSSLRDYSRKEIMAAYGVQPVMITDMEGATKANAFVQQAQFWNGTMLPKLIKYAQMWNKYIIHPMDESLSLEVDISNFLVSPEQANFNKKLQVTLFEKGITILNEARDYFQLGPDKSGRGNLYMFDINTPSLPATIEQTIELEEEVPVPQDNKMIAGTEVDDKFIDTFKVDDAVAIAFNTVKDREDDKFSIIINNLFKRQIDAITPLIDVWEKQSEKSSLRKADELNMDIVLETLDKSFEEVKIEVAAGIRQSTKSGYKIAYRILKLKPDERYVSSEGFAQEFIAKKTLKLKGDLNSTTTAHIKSTIDRGIKEGHSIARIAEGLKEGLDDTIMSNDRALMVARTEVNGAVNFGAEESYRDSGVVKTQRWLATSDDRVRDTHAAASGQERKLDEKFSVGSDMLERPGDPNGSPGEIINCRCCLIPGKMKGRE